MLSILRLFKQQGWKVEFATPAQATEHMADLGSEGVSSQSIELNSDSFDSYVMTYKPDIVLFDRFMMEEQFGWRVDKYCPRALKILDTEDLQCLRHARHQAVKAEREMTLDDLYSDIAKREIAAILRCDLSLVISSYEIQLLTETFKIDSSLLYHLPFMVDLEKCPTHTKGFSQRNHFISIGNFRHAPNWDMVLYLQKIWPKIRQKIPDAELHIYGAYPPPKATALNNPATGFLVKGWAEDALSVMESARVCLAPLRFGAGIKGKLLDAMIVQTPSVTTTIGSEGMYQYAAGTDEAGSNVICPDERCPDEIWPGAVVDDIAGFVNAALEIYTDEKAWNRSSRAASRLLNKYYDARLSGAGLIDKIIETDSHIKQHRLNNFTGAMLKHHTMKSTQYMSQWIAAKNSKVV